MHALTFLRYCTAALLLFWCSAECSKGDVEPRFLRCIEECRRTGCVGTSHCETTCRWQEVDLPFFLRIMKWDCESDCKYHCMHMLNNMRVARWGKEYSWKYYGKWPFIRILGMQEPASVLFSLLHFAFHVFYLIKYLHFRKQTVGFKRSKYPFGWLWTLEEIVSLNTWIWSAAFHCRDTPITETLDYASAIFSIYYGLFRAIIRSFEFTGVRTLLSTAILTVGLYVFHLYYLFFIHFDYGLNIFVCTTVGVVQLLLLLGWVFVTRHAKRYLVLSAACLLYAAVLLEIFDFPPLYGFLDAHSLWHLVTLPAPFAWYLFYCSDTLLTGSKLKEG